MMDAVAALDKVHAYQHDDFVLALEKKLQLTRTDAVALFGDLKTYLWLSAQRIQDHDHRLVPTSDIRIDDDLYLLDEAWHLFLQYTRDYAEFCQAHFGFFLHHEPVTEKDREEISLDQRRDQFREQLSWIYDRAGRETVERWFLTKSLKRS